MFKWCNIIKISKQDKSLDTKSHRNQRGCRGEIY